MPDNVLPLAPEELILAEDLVDQVRKRLGQHHPAYPYLDVSVQFRKRDLPGRYQSQVDEDWVWWMQYPYWLLARLSLAREVVPTCWILRSKLDTCRRNSDEPVILIASARDYSLPDAQKASELAAIKASWTRVYPGLAAEGAAQEVEPDDLGDSWMGMLEWRLPSEIESQFLGAGPLPDLRWQPFYRIRDIATVVRVIASDAMRSSAFGDVPTRRLGSLIGKLRKKYAVDALGPVAWYREPAPDYPYSPESARRQTRADVVLFLDRNGYDFSDIKAKFIRWSQMATTILRKRREYREAGIDDQRIRQALARELEAPIQVIDVIWERLDGVKAQSRRKEAARIDSLVFGCDPRTIKRTWESVRSNARASA